MVEIQNKGNKEEHFFTVVDSNVEATIKNGFNRYTVETDKYMAILDKDAHFSKIHGVRKSIVLNHPNPTQVATHQEAYEGLRYLYDTFSFGEHGDPIAIYPLGSSNWFSVFYGIKKNNLNDWLISYLENNPREKSWVQELMNKNPSFAEDLYSYKDYLENNKPGLFTDNLDIPTTPLSDYSYYLAVRNGYDFDDKVTYYLMISYNGYEGIKLLLDLNNWNFSIEQINSIMSLMTLQSVSINTHDIPYSNSIGKNPLKPNIDKLHICRSLQNSLLNFIETIIILETETLPSHVLSAVTLDMYDMNRNRASLENDGDLIRKIRHRYVKSRKFYESFGDDVKVSALLSRIICDVQNFYPLSTLYNKEFDNVLSRKEAYRKVLKVIPQAIQNNKFEKYWQGQVKAFEEIQDLIIENR